MAYFSRKITYILFLLVAFYVANVTAEVSEPIINKDGIIEVKLSGRITSLDVNKFKQIDSYVNAIRNTYPDNKFYLLVQLDSAGGDLVSAINIGDLLREKEAIAIVAEPWKCYSACVFVLAGAPIRKVYGKIGIHRPYNPNDLSTNARTQKAIQKEREVLVKSYLSDMNISLDLYNDMLRVPPEKNKVLSEAELVKYGLIENDPFWEDAQTAKHAKRLGITSEDYLKRKIRANELCSKFANDQNKLADCILKITDYGAGSYE